MSTTPSSLCPSDGVFESFPELCWTRSKDGGQPNVKLSSKPSCRGTPEAVCSVETCRKEAVSDCMEGSSVGLLGRYGIRIPAWVSRFISSVSSWRSRFPSRWSLLRITWEWWELLFTERTPLHIGHEMLVKPVEGIWTSPQFGHSASTALPYWKMANSAVSSILSIKGRFTKTKQDKRGVLCSLSLENPCLDWWYVPNFWLKKRRNENLLKKHLSDPPMTIVKSEFECPDWLTVSTSRGGIPRFLAT